MARSIIARQGIVVAFAATTLVACDRTATETSASSPLPTEVSFARGTNRGGGNGGAAKDQPTVAITPTTLDLVVGQQFTVSVTYWDNRGNVVPVTDDKLVFYGCNKLADTDPDCNSVISILPLAPSGREARITAKAAGAIQLYAGDGLGTWVYSAVTVQ